MFGGKGGDLETMASGHFADLGGKTVAVVDDDIAVCDSIRALFEVYNISVRTYQSGSDFLHENPDVVCIIIDYQMPALNGLDLVSELRKHGVTAPVIMITAASDASIEQRAAALRVSQVLRKPLGTQVLLDAIRKEMA